MFGSKLLGPVLGVVVAAVLVGSLLPAMGRYYVQSTAIIIGMAVLIAAHWQELDKRVAWVVGASVIAAAMLYLGHPSHY